MTARTLSRIGKSRSDENETTIGRVRRDPALGLYTSEGPTSKEPSPPIEDRCRPSRAPRQNRRPARSPTADQDCHGRHHEHQDNGTRRRRRVPDLEAERVHHAATRRVHHVVEEGLLHIGEEEPGQPAPSSTAGFPLGRLRPRNRVHAEQNPGSVRAVAGNNRLLVRPLAGRRIQLDQLCPVARVGH